MRNIFSNPMVGIFLLFMAYSSFRSGAFSDPKEWIMRQILILPGIVIGLTFHEFAHAVVAYKLGDDTPKVQGWQLCRHGLLYDRRGPDGVPHGLKSHCRHRKHSLAAGRELARRPSLGW